MGHQGATSSSADYFLGTNVVGPASTRFQICWGIDSFSADQATAFLVGSLEFYGPELTQYKCKMGALCAPVVLGRGFGSSNIIRVVDGVYNADAELTAAPACVVGAAERTPTATSRKWLSVVWQYSGPTLSTRTSSEMYLARFLSE
jgi:hypothetical protein